MSWVRVALYLVGVSAFGLGVGMGGAPGSAGLWRAGGLLLVVVGVVAMIGGLVW